MSASLYAQVTQAIPADLDAADPSSWVCPWHRTTGGLPANATTQRPYRGINILSLWCRARASGYASDRWATYRQWASLGAQVRRGETGALVVFYKDVAGRNQDAADACSSTDAASDAARPSRFIAKASTVFNIAQVDNVPAATHGPDATPPSTPIDPTPVFDAFVARAGARIQVGGDRAAYVPSTDTILMPPRDAFVSTDGYTATAAHELVHWTAAPHRLARDLTQRFGSRAYAAEELVAELGSAFVLAGLGLAATPHPQHAAYMANWLPLLRQDPRALFTAAARASAAADYLQATPSERV